MIVMSEAESFETRGESTASVRLDAAFLALLCCPICPARPALTQQNDGLLCSRCGRAYPIRDGLPDLRPESGVLPTATD